MEHQEHKGFETRLKEVLNKLELTRYYPGKITRNEMYQITKESLIEKEPTCLNELGWFFLIKISQYNYNARNANVSVDHKGTTQATPRWRTRTKPDGHLLHPLDVVIAVFLCCDSTSQHDLIKHLWNCRLAVPFGIPVEKVSPKLFLWPLRSIVMRWQTLVDNSNEAANEKRIVSHPMQSIGFIRLSETPVSKSDMINCLITGAEKPHPMFFHRGCPGSSKQRCIADGLLEVGWFFPKGKKEDFFQHAMRFVNIRGQAQDHPLVLESLVELSDHVVIFCNSIDIIKSLDLFTKIMSKAKNILLVITDSPGNDKVVDERITEIYRMKALPEDALDVILIESKQRAELVKEMRTALKGFKAQTLVSLDAASKYLSKTSNVLVDENGDIHVSAKRSAEGILKNIKEIDPYKRKETLLPLQGALWKTWSNLDKETYRLKKKEPHEEVIDYQERLKSEQASLRTAQFKHVSGSETDTSLDHVEDGSDFLNPGESTWIKKVCYKIKLPSIISAFVEGIDLHNHQRIPIFLQWMKQMLDDMSREELLPVFQDLKEHWNSKAVAKNDKERNTAKQKIEATEAQLSKLSFGLEHIVREMGQIYEAVISNLDIVQNQEHVCEALQILPIVAGQLLLNGQPLEIMDGDVSSVPVMWVTGVFDYVVQYLKEKEGQNTRVFVLSVLGIQSSGKSTLLNTLFGLQFAVSAGRCTRGVFVQLVKLETEMRQTLKIDYIIAVDTEGLQNPELSSESGRAHDNELSTFVIGLGDLTLINIMGENTTYLGEFLPISVHAFLRMKFLDMDRKCVIVHQNVDKCDKDKLLQQRIALEGMLNEMTGIACNFENVEPREFKDVIGFDITTGIFNMPGLLEGEQPMAPISIGYSSECCALRRKIFGIVNLFNSQVSNKDPQEICSIECTEELVKDALSQLGSLEDEHAPISNQRLKTLGGFQNYLCNLWSSIQKDDFVYEFKSIIETQARSALDDELCKRSVRFRDEIKVLTSKAYKCLSNADTEEAVSKTKNQLIRSVHDKIEDVYLEQLECLLSFVRSQKSVQGEVISKWERDSNHCLQCLREDLERDYKQKLEEFSDDRLRELHIDTEKKEYETTLIATIKKAAQIEKDKGIEASMELSDEDVTAAFERHWKEWLVAIDTRYPRPRRTANIESDMSAALENLFRSHHVLLREKRQIKHLREYNLGDFAVHHNHWQGTNWERLKQLKAYVYDQGQADPKKACVLSVAQSLQMSVVALITSIESRHEPYHTGMISNIIDIQRKHHEHTNVKLTPQFKVDIGVAIGGYAIQKLEAMHEEIERSRSPRGILEKSKAKFGFLFKTYFTKTNTVGYTVNICLDSVWWCLEATMQQELPQKLVHAIKQGKAEHILTSKRTLMTATVLQLLKDENFETIHMYISNPVLSIRMHLKRVVNEFCDSKVDGTMNIRRLADTMAEDKFLLFKEAVDSIHKDMSKKKPKNFVSWKKLLKNTIGNELILKDLDSLLMDETNMFDIDAFSEEFCRQLQERRKDLVTKLGEIFEDDPTPRNKVENELLDAIIGCTALCPLCNALCALNKGHESSHQGLFHKPVGCAGCKDSASSELLATECDRLWFSKRKVFCRKEGKDVALSDLRTVYKDWVFSHDTEIPRSFLWNYVYVKYIEELTCIYSATQSLIPRAWRRIDKDEEITLLQNLVDGENMHRYFYDRSRHSRGLWSSIFRPYENLFGLVLKTQSHLATHRNPKLSISQ